MFSAPYSSSLAALVMAATMAAAWNKPQTFDVQVSNANADTIYTPPFVFAEPGDKVEFYFHPKNHTVTQSSFEDPCTPLDDGFSSGFVPVPGSQTSNFPTFTLCINDTDPVWIHCEQAANTAASHCGAGMVFAVNPPKSGPMTFDAFKAAALAIGDELKASATTTVTPAPTTVTPPPTVVTPAPTTVTPAPTTVTPPPTVVTPAPTPTTCPPPSFCCGCCF